MIKAVIYARFSSSKQSEQSIEGQLRICNLFAKENDFKIVNNYIDRAASGTNDNRLEFQRMIKDSSKNLFEVVIVYQYDRFARNRRDSMNNKFILRNNGVRLLSATEPEITNRPSDLFMEGILDTAAEFYSRDLAQKTVRGMKENLIKKKTIGGRTPLGYKVIDKKYSIDYSEAEIVKKIFTEYANARKIKDIIYLLHSNGITNRGRKFKASTISDLIKNTKYVGLYRDPFSNNIITDMFPRIIGDDLFDQAKRERERKMQRTKPNPRNKGAEYFLTGKIFCGYCGMNLTGMSGSSQNGNKYRYYKCKSNKCELKPIRKDFIEDCVLNHVIDYVTQDKTLDYVIDEIIKSFKNKLNETSLTSLKQEKKRLESQLDKIVSNYLDASSVIKERLNEESIVLSDKIKNIDSQIEKINILENRKVYDKIFLKSWINDLFKDKEKITRNAVDYFINSIYCFNDKVIIYMSFDVSNSDVVTFVEMKEDIIRKEKNEPTIGSFKRWDGGPSRG
ncbi:MAG: recombinase family protein [Bacilli bacterium]|nr:recombinase family protein [Bacilli bacterium]MCH4235185.1 recombinase family protein [Bacilli bacterium]HMM00847.1 recombinase family protein [Bacilli bacterium]